MNTCLPGQGLAEADVAAQNPSAVAGGLLLLLAALSRDRGFALVAVDILAQLVSLDLQPDTPTSIYLVRMGGLDRLSRLLVPKLTPQALKVMENPG